MRDEGKFEHQTSPGPQDAGQFGKECGPVLDRGREVLEDLRAHNEIEGPRGKGKPSDIAVDQVGLPDLGRRLGSPSQFTQHVQTEIERNDIPSPSRKEERMPARPTTGIENSLRAVPV